MREGQISLRSLFAIIAAVAVPLGGFRWFSLLHQRAHREAVRAAYIDGRITFEAAYDRVGDVAAVWRAEREATNDDDPRP